MIEKDKLERKIEICTFNKQGIIDNVEAKLSKNQPVKKSVLERIADELDCNVEDIMEEKQ